MSNLVRKLSFRRGTKPPPEPPFIAITPGHVFNPPPSNKTINGKLRMPVGMAISDAPSEFLMQLHPRQPMQSALRTQLQPAEAGYPTTFYIVPANQPPGTPSPSPSEATLEDDMLESRAAPWNPHQCGADAASSTGAEAPSDSVSVKSGVSAFSSSTYFTACSSPSSGSNTRDNTLDFSRASTLDFTGSAPATLELSAQQLQPHMAPTELALRLSPRVLSGGDADIEGGGAERPPTFVLPLAAAVPAAQHMPRPAPSGAWRRCARLLCDVQLASTSQFVMCDDPHNEYGVPRELGAVLIRGALLRVIIPRVHVDRTVAQFPVRTPEDSMLARYQQSEDLRHMSLLDGSVLEGKLTLKSLDTGAMVLEIAPEIEPDGTPALGLKYTAPLSAFQALCVALCLCAVSPDLHHGLSAQHTPPATGPPVFTVVQ